MGSVSSDTENFLKQIKLLELKLQSVRLENKHMERINGKRDTAEENISKSEKTIEILKNKNHRYQIYNKDM
jgi:hypothetical protein